MHALVNGPLNKSLHTEMYELFVKCNLHAKQTINYSLEDNLLGKENLYASMGSIKLNISELSQKATLNHLSLNANDSQKFINAFDNSGYYDSYYSHYSEKYSAINPGERQAIQNYTGSEYYSINSFLHGKTSSITSYYYNDNGINESAHRLVLNTAFLSSGLNKIMPELDYQGKTYRGEHAASKEEIQSRIDLIDSDFPISDSLAFMSTSSDNWVGQGFNSGSFITFDGAYGKDISGLSHFESESEYLVLPNQILWESYNYSNGTYYFKASIVAPLIEGKDTPSQEEIAQFQKLVEFAQNNNVDTDFITQFNQSIFLNSKDTVEISDVLSDVENNELLFAHPEISNDELNHYNHSDIITDSGMLPPSHLLSDSLVETMDAMLLI